MLAPPYCRVVLRRHRMIEILYKFSWESIKFDYQVLACMILIWITVIICTISSILSRPFAGWQKGMWIALVVFMPAFGLLFYLPFSLNSDIAPELDFARRVRR